MLIVPILVPPVGAALGAEGRALGEAAAPVPAVGLPVWAVTEIAETAATARRSRKNLLFIGSVELLGTCLFEPADRNMLV